MTIYLPDIQGRPGPKYRAIADAMAEDMVSGALPAGTKLPTHRDLAYRLGVTVGTVTRAYQELERKGLTGGRVGSGTYVLDPAKRRQVFSLVTSTDERPERPPHVIAHSTPRDGEIDLSMNRPSPGPEAQALAETLGELSQADGLQVLTTYNPAPGLMHHRDAMAGLLSSLGLTCQGDDIILTSGAQHAMAACALGLLKAGDVILTEALTYPGMTSLAQHLSARVRPVAMDDRGLRPDALEAAVRESGARVVYLMPVHQNPTTAVMDEERLDAIAQVAKAHDLIIIEDDIYGFQPLSRPAPLAERIPDNTLYISGFAKSIAPGLRVGCIKAPKHLFPAIIQAVQITGWMIPPLMGEIAARWITSGVAGQLIDWHRQEMIARNAIAADILKAFTFTQKPECLHLWLDVPDGHHAIDVVREAQAAGVTLAGPESFSPTLGPTPGALRLCLGSPVSRELLSEGLGRLRAILAAKPVSMLARLDNMVM